MLADYKLPELRWLPAARRAVKDLPSDLMRSHLDLMLRSYIVDTALLECQLREEAHKAPLQEEMRQVAEKWTQHRGALPPEYRSALSTLLNGLRPQRESRTCLCEIVSDSLSSEQRNRSCS